MFEFSGTEITDDCESPCVYLEANMGVLEKQVVLLITELSLPIHLLVHILSSQILMRSEENAGNVDTS